jgi:hypothetical protein
VIFPRAAKKAAGALALFLAILPGAALVLACPGTIAWQCLSWLRTGHWTPLIIRDGWHWLGIAEPETSWLGVNKIIDMALNGPLSLGVFGAGVSLLFVFGAVMALTESQRANGGDPSVRLRPRR